MSVLALTPANIIPSVGNFVRGTAGATIAAGDLIYRDANKLLQLSDANGAVAAQNVDGIAVSSGAAGQPVNYVTDDPELATGAGVAGTPYFLSGTPGKMCELADLAAPMRMIFVAGGLLLSKLNFRPVAGGTIPTP
ncbi:MAG: hypothetical protein QOE70_4048 [Chthoniobacter sp.]|jgi:hypothetical protein|nr:hypothetical protein [Chthoniobacter sp.]